MNLQFPKYITLFISLLVSCQSVTQRSVDLTKIGEYQVGKLCDFKLNQKGDKLFICENGLIRICGTSPPFNEIQIKLDYSPMRVEFTADGKYILFQDAKGITLLTVNNYDFVKRIQVDSVLLNRAEKIIALSDSMIFMTYAEYEPVRLTKRYDRLYYSAVHVYDIVRKSERQVTDNIVSYAVDDSCKMISAILNTNNVAVWNLVDLNKILVIPDGGSINTKVYISNKSQFLAILEVNNDLILWDLITMSKIGSFELGANVAFFYPRISSHIVLTQYGIVVDNGMQNLADALPFDSIAGLDVRVSGHNKLFAVHIKKNHQIVLWSINGAP